ncbi:MAG: hypothetical protein IKK91_05310 [Ruminococcus sp.]|nr:hypothetical protein [Ruminococcus sp.]
MNIDEKRTVPENNEPEYFICGNCRILITEHFPEKGRTFDELIKDLILYTAKKAQ